MFFIIFVLNHLLVVEKVYNIEQQALQAWNHKEKQATDKGVFVVVEHGKEGCFVITCHDQTALSCC